MNKTFQITLPMLALPLFFAGCSQIMARPTKQIVQPAQGMAVAQEVCPKYAGDETKEAACVLFYGGAFKKDAGKYSLNVPLAQPVETNVDRQPGTLIKCKAEMIYLKDGGIGWREGKDCH